MTNIRKSLIISFAERYLLIILKLISFIVLARLLTPEDIGLVSVSVAFIGLAHIVRDFGVGSYLIQEKDLTSERKRTSFTITLIIGVSLFFVLQLLSPYIADFYSDQRMQYVIQVLSFNFLLIPFNSVTLALLRREMKFSIMFAINISAAIVGTASAVTLAALDVGYMSLVWSSIASTATTCLGGLIYRKNEFWMRPTLKDWRRIFNFGSQATAANIITEISMNANDLIVGRVLGFAPVAIISRAQGVMYLFQRDIMSAIRNVAYPGFAKAYREKTDLEGIYIRTISAITAIAWPFYALLSLYSLEFLRILFGPQWDAASPLVPVFCLAGAIAAMWNLHPQVLMAMGRIDLSTKAVVTVQLVRLASIITCAIFFDTLMPFAVAFLVAFIISSFIHEHFKSKALKTNWRMKVDGLYRSGLLTFITLSGPVLLKILNVTGTITLNMYFTVSISCIVAAISWLIGLQITKHSIINDPIFPQKLKTVLEYKWRSPSTH